MSTPLHNMRALLSRFHFAPRPLSSLSLRVLSMSFACDPPCGRTFKSAAAREQHKVDAPKHSKDLGRVQSLARALLETQTASSPAHRPHSCVPCGKVFGSGSALDAHLKDSPAHQKIMCLPCNMEFASESALKAHVGASPKHKTPDPATFSCPACNKSFGSQSALAMHLKSTKHNSTKPDAPDTPLDRFFRLYPGFPYNRKLSPDESFRQLTAFSGWKKDSDPQKDAWRKYKDALVEEVDLWFGDTSDIHAWHHLCRAVGASDPPPTIKECKKIIKRTHVNIVDLVDWGRAGSPASRPVKIFKTEDMLSDYTRKHDRIFPRKLVLSRDGHGNIVLKHLLRKIVSWD